MKKIIEFSVALCVSMICLMLTWNIQLTCIDILWIIQLISELLCIVLSIGGFMLVYNNIESKINNKANYMAISMLVYSVIHVMALGCYLTPSIAMTMRGYEIYKFIKEWLQIGILVNVVCYINEESNIKKWVIANLISGVFIILLIFLDFSLMRAFFLEWRVQIGWRMLTGIGIIILLGINYQKIESRRSFQGKILVGLFGIKVCLCAIGVGSVLFDGVIVQTLQCLLQALFMVGIILYIDEVTLGNTWIQTEIIIKEKEKEVSIGINGQKILKLITKEIKFLIDKNVVLLDVLERRVDNYFQNSDKKYIDKIRDNGQKLLQLIRAILESNAYEWKVEGVSFQWVDLNELVKETIESLEPYLKQQDIDLEYIVQKEKVLAKVNANAIEHMLLNLISNAVKYSQTNGRIRVSLSARKGYVYLCVQDFGIGISKSNLDKIFERFRRIESERTHRQEGSGLGLSIVKSIVDMHNGEIKVASGEGVGTLISIQLPEEQVVKSR